MHCGQLSGELRQDVSGWVIKQERCQAELIQAGCGILENSVGYPGRGSCTKGEDLLNFTKGIRKQIPAFSSSEVPCIRKSCCGYSSSERKRGFRQGR